MNLTLKIATALFAASSLGMAEADEAHHNHDATPAQVKPAAWSEGEIMKVDKPARKLTIKHGPLANLDMPGMTMVFGVKDAAILEQVKAGDRISFIADRPNGQLTVTDLRTK